MQGKVSAEIGKSPRVGIGRAQPHGTQSFGTQRERHLFVGGGCLR